MRVSDWKWMEQGEGLVMRLAVWSLLFLFFIQLLLFIPEFRPVLSYVDKLEGESIDPSQEERSPILSSIVELLK